MKNFFKKLNKGQETEQDNLNLDYGDFYSGRADDRRSDDRRADDRRGDDRFDERFDDRRVDDRRGDDRFDRADINREEPASDRSANGYYDLPKNPRGGYEEPDFRSDSPRYGENRYYDAERPMERSADRSAEPVESYVKPRDTWQEADAPGYRAADRGEAAPTPAPAPAPVFTPAPAPEYLYFTPSTYRDCREGIVKGLATGHVVVVRLRKLAAGDVLRLFDYMMGAVLALDGEMVRPAATTVVLVPKDVELKESEIEPDEDEPVEDDLIKDEEEEEEEYEDGEEYDEEEYDEEEYDEEEYEEDSYENGEYGAYEEDEEYEEDEYEEEYEEEYEDGEEYESEEEYEDEYEEDEEYEEEEYEEDYDEEYEEEYEEEYDEDESEEEYEDEADEDAE